MTPKQTQYLNQYLDRCWKARQYYKDETNKLLYWVGTIFIALVGATGIFGANQSNKFHFEFKHIIIFHAGFTVITLYYLYKQLNTDLYSKLGSLIESYLREKIQMDKFKDFQSFFGLKDHYLGGGQALGRNLTRTANLIMITLYLTVTSLPLYYGSVSLNGGVLMNWSFIAISLLFPAILLIAHRSYLKERARVLSKLEHDWNRYVARFEEHCKEESQSTPQKEQIGDMCFGESGSHL